jgi:DNA-binding response OmpR family regulator
MSATKAHILLVEDDQNFGSLLKNYLGLSGYRVEWAIDGNLGYSRFRQMKFDLCLLDVMMPYKDGFTLAEEIRKADTQVPIIFLTARGDKEDQIRGYRAGADDYLTKPFDSELLLIKLESVLKRTSIEVQAEPESYSLGSYSFIPRKRLLIHQDAEEKLSPKESALLSMLCKFQNEVMPRRKALMEIWNNDDYFATRSMDVYVAKLRKRLKKDPRLMLDNLHGEGYFFKVGAGRE